MAPRSVLHLGAALLLVGGAALLVASSLLISGLPAPPAATPLSRCGLPDGIELRALPPGERVTVSRRALLCADLEHGRIDRARYDEELAALLNEPAPPAAPAATRMAWADSVRALSSEWTGSSWSARSALGPPDVYPRAGSNAAAWTASAADAQIEFLELGFHQPVQASGVSVFETSNPGAVTRIELLGAAGERRIVYDAPAAPDQRPAVERAVAFSCTGFPVVAVRVTIDAPAVPGWNEIDAVGLRTCQE